MSRIILASASPRRRSLLSMMGYDYEIMVSQADEKTDKVLPHEAVEELSYIKAMDVYRLVHENNVNNTYDKELIIIGADTVVSVDGDILGKPGDNTDAYDMLKRLQGRQHEVYTGVTIVRAEGSKYKVKTFNECTRVSFYPMTDEEIFSYIATGDPMDKAGAYGIQSGAAIYISGIEGDYNNVVGLPVARLYHELNGIHKDTSGV